LEFNLYTDKNRKSIKKIFAISIYFWQTMANSENFFSELRQNFGNLFLKRFRKNLFSLEDCEEDNTELFE
jgi:hypothetical protein